MQAWWCGGAGGAAQRLVGCATATLQPRRTLTNIQIDVHALSARASQLSSNPDRHEPTLQVLMAWSISLHAACQPCPSLAHHSASLPRTHVLNVERTLQILTTWPICPSTPQWTTLPTHPVVGIANPPCRS